MNYLEARIEMLKEKPRIPLSAMALEALVLVAVAAIPVRIFA